MTLISASKINITPQEFEVIIKSNNLRKLWYEKLGLKNTSYIQFISNIIKTPCDVIEPFDSKIKEEFYADLPEMLSPLAYEERIINGCKSLVYKIALLMKIKDEELEDVASIGFMVVRNCVWQFNKTDATFITYAYRAIRNKFVTYKKLASLSEKRNNFVLFSKFTKENGGIDNIAVCKNTSNELPTTMICKNTGRTLGIRDVMYRVAKDSLDTKIVDLYFLEGNKWVSKILELGGEKQVSKASLYKRFGNMVNRAKEYIFSNANIYHAR